MILIFSEKKILAEGAAMACLRAPHTSDHVRPASIRHRKQPSELAIHPCLIGQQKRDCLTVLAMTGLD